MPRKTEIQAEEAAVSSPLRRSSRIGTSSPAPALISTRNLQLHEAPEPKATKSRRSSLAQESSENNDIKENKPAPRGRRGSAAKEETEEKPEPVKTRSRRSSAATEPTAKEEARQTITRRRRSSAVEESSEPESEAVKSVKTRRRSITETSGEDSIAKKPTRGKSLPKDANEDINEQPVRKSLRGRAITIAEKTDEAVETVTKEKRSTRGRRASTDKLEDEPDTKTARLTPSKSRRRLSIAESTANLEPIKEQELETKSRKSTSPTMSNLKVVLDSSPVRNKTPDKDKATKTSRPTPSKSKRRLSLSEGSVNLESVEEPGSDAKNEKRDSPIDKDLNIVLNSIPVKSDKSKEVKAHLDLSVIDESSFTDDKESSVRESPGPPAVSAEEKTSKMVEDEEKSDETKLVDVLKQPSTQEVSLEENKKCLTNEDTGDISEGHENAVQETSLTSGSDEKSSVEAVEKEDPKSASEESDPKKSPKLSEEDENIEIVSEERTSDEIISKTSPSEAGEVISVESETKDQKNQNEISSPKDSRKLTPKEIAREEHLGEALISESGHRSIDEISSPKESPVKNAEIVSEKHINEDVAKKTSTPKPDEDDQASTDEISSPEKLPKLTQEESTTDEHTNGDKITLGPEPDELSSVETVDNGDKTEEPESARENENIETDGNIDKPNPDYPDIIMGSDGSFKFNMNLSLPSTNSQNLSRGESTEDDLLNSSKASDSSDKENMDINLLEPAVENKEKIIETLTSSSGNCSEMKAQTTVVARVSNVFRPKMVEYSFVEPMDVDDSPRVLRTKQNKTSIELDESKVEDVAPAKPTPNEEGCIKPVEQLEESTSKTSNETIEDDSIDESFKLSLSITHIGQPCESKNTSQDEDVDSTLESEWTQGDAEVSSKQDGAAEDLGLRSDIEDLKSEVITKPTDLRADLTPERTEEKSNESNVQESLLSEENTEKENSTESLDKCKSPQLHITDEVKQEEEDVKTLEVHPAEKKVEEIESSQSSADLEEPLKKSTSTLDASPDQDQAKNQKLSHSVSPKPQHMSTPGDSNEDDEDNLLRELDKVIDVKVQKKLTSENLQHDLGDDKTEVATTVENLDTEIDPATENRPDESTNMEISKVHLVEDPSDNLEQKSSESGNPQPSLDSQLRETEDSEEITEKLAADDALKESEHAVDLELRDTENLMQKSESPLPQHSTTTSKSDVELEQQKSMDQVAKSENLQVRVEHTLIQSKSPLADLDGQFEQQESKEASPKLDLELDEDENTVLKTSEPSQLGDDVKKGENISSTSSDSIGVMNIDLNLDRSKEIEDTKSPGKPNDPIPLKTAGLEQRPDSPIPKECVEDDLPLPESKEPEKVYVSDDYEFDVPSEDEQIEKTEELKFKQCPFDGKSQLEDLEDTSAAGIDSSKEAESEICSANTEDTESSKGIISTRESGVKDDLEQVNAGTNVVLKEDDADETEEKCPHTVKEDVLPIKEETFTMESSSTSKLETSMNKDIGSTEDKVSPKKSDVQHELEQINTGANVAIKEENCADETEEKCPRTVKQDVMETNEETFVIEADTLPDVSTSNMNDTVDEETQQKLHDNDPNKAIIDHNKRETDDVKEKSELSSSMDAQESGDDHLHEQSTQAVKESADYTEMESSFKDVVQGHNEKVDDKKKLKKVKRASIKDKGSKKLDRKEKLMLSDTNKEPEDSVDKISPSTKSKVSKSDEPNTDVSENIKKAVKKHKKHKIPVDNKNPGIISSVDETETDKQSHGFVQQEVKSDSKDVTEISNDTNQAVDITINAKEDNRKEKTGKRKSKIVKTKSRDTAEETYTEMGQAESCAVKDSLIEGGKAVKSPLKKCKKSKKKIGKPKTKECTDSSESFGDPDIGGNEGEKLDKQQRKDDVKSDKGSLISENIVHERGPVDIKVNDEEIQSDGIEDHVGKFVLKDTEVLEKEQYENVNSTKEDRSKEDSDETPSLRKRSKKHKKKAKIVEENQIDDLEHAGNESEQPAETNKKETLSEVSSTKREHRKRRLGEETTHLQTESSEYLGKRKKNLDTKAESDSDEDVSPLKQSTKEPPLEKFPSSKFYEYLSRNITEIENEEEIYADTAEELDEEETSREGNEFISSMAEEGEEDTPSEDSNAIIDVGESINTTESEADTDDDYDDDSFICDEEASELLSGNEYDLDNADYLDDEKKKKSRIIQLDDYEGDVIKIKRKEKPVQKKRSRIITISDSSDTEGDKEEAQDSIEEDTKPNLQSSEQSSCKEDESTAEEKTDDVIILEEPSPISTPIKADDKSDTATSTLDTTANEETNRQKKRKSSITIHENISVTEIKDAALSERISNLVDTFCTSIRKGEISMDLSLKYADEDDAEKSSPTDDNVFAEDTKKTKKVKRGKRFKKSGGSSSHYKSEDYAGHTKLAGKATKDSSADTLSSDSHEQDTPPTKRERLSITLEDIGDSDGLEKRLSRKRRLSKSLEDLHKTVDKRKKKKTGKALEKAEKDLAAKKRRKNITKVDKKKKRFSGENKPCTKSFSIINQLITDVRNRPIRTIKPTRHVADLNTSWITEIADVRPSTSLSIRRDITEYNTSKIYPRQTEIKSNKIHPKDFRTQMLYNSSRIKRVDTKTLLKKKGAYF